MHPQSGHWIGPLVTVAILAIVIALRWRNIGKVRPLKPERLWIVPAAYGVVATLTFAAAPPHGAAWFSCFAALLAGAVLGWYRGRMVAISVDPATHALSQSTSPAAMLFIVAILLFRFGVRALVVGMHGGQAMMLLVTDILIAFALGFLAVQRLEMAGRARGLLRRARAEQSA